MNSTETEEVISKARIEMHLKRASEGYGLTNHVGKSKVWESFLIFITMENGFQM